MLRMPDEMPHPAREILMVSKAIAPPWNDGSKNLVRMLAEHGEHFSYRVLTTGAPPPFAAGRVCQEPLFTTRSRHAPGLFDNARVFQRLLRRRDNAALASFFFSPNVLSGIAAQVALALRSRIAVQTICSTPKTFDGLDQMLFGDRIVALSEHTRERLLRHGVDANRVRHIRPGIEPLPPLDDAQRAAVRKRHRLPAGGLVAIYPGDYEFSGTAQSIAQAVPHLGKEWTVIFACRPKTTAAAGVQRALDQELRASGCRAQVRMLGAVADIHQLLGAVDLCLLPAEHLYAKMDIPLVLLEALSMQVPVITCDRPPLNELVSERTGALVPPLDSIALAQAVRSLGNTPERRRRCGIAGRARVATTYNIRETARHYEALYQELLP